MHRTYRVQEFAELAGVTVKALHHYDRLGLLSPARSDAGYRLYTAKDLERLQQIVALRFLGCPLKDIRAVLDRTSLPLPATLRYQRTVLEQQRERLNQAIQALADAERAFEDGNPSLADVLRRVIAAMHTRDIDVMRKYYSEEAWPDWQEYFAHWPPPEWQALYTEVNAAGDLDPASAEAQAFAERWLDLTRQRWKSSTSEGRLGYMKAWGDREHWPPVLQQRMSQFNVDRASRFITEALWAKWEAQRDAAQRQGMVPHRASESRRTLFRDCLAAIDGGPHTAAAQSLVERWRALIDVESGGDAETREQMFQSFRGRSRWPAGMKQYIASLNDADVPTWERVQDFLEACDVEAERRRAVSQAESERRQAVHVSEARSDLR